MAVTNGWGQGVINNTNGWGKLATNNIGEGSIYENSHSGDTALIGTSAAFSYDKTTYNQGEANPTPTITGTPGGTFSSDAGVSFVSTSTGEIDLSASTIASHTIFYIVDGVQASQTIDITAAPYTSTSSFSFDGVNDYFDIGNPTNLQLTNNISVSGWFKTSSSSTMNMFTKRASGVNNWAVYMQSGKIYFWVSVDGSSVPVQIISATTLNDGNWHFFAGVREGTSLKLYIDNLTPVSGTIAAGSLSNPTGTVMIGKAAVNNFLWSGNIDELAIWDTNLSSAAVTEIASGPNDLESLTNASSSNLVAWYKMGE
jgi:hypothetical protein